jgi:hypothetical protein
MIHDARVEVTCDTCSASIDVWPEYVYRNWSGSSGYYDASESAIEAKLEHEGWFIQEGKHYCSADCVPEAIMHSPEETAPKPEAEAANQKPQAGG